MHPDASLTCRDLILRVAERAGVAFRSDSANDNTATIPLDPHDLDKCMRAVNDARETHYQLVRAAPAMKPEVTVTLTPEPGAENPGGDVSRVRLPWFVVGGPAGDFEWALADNSWWGVCSVVHYSRVQAAYAHDRDRTGRPEIATVVPLADDAGAGAVRPGWALWVHPKPDAVYTMRARFPLHFAPFATLDAREPLGREHDQAIIEWAVCKYHARHPDAAYRAELLAKAQAASQLALQAALDAAPKNIGQMRITTGRGRAPLGADSRANYVLASYNGVPN